MKVSQKNYKRIVIKIGSSLFYRERGAFDAGVARQISEEVAALIKSGREVVIVSSGAIAIGMQLLGLKSRPKELASLQAAAAVGQGELMNIYRSLFKEKSLNCGQVLLTWEDFDDRRRYLNAKNTALSLLRLGIIPVINENDTVSTDEIRFGDNDRLSALVAALVSADLLIILTDVDGLLAQDKRTLVKVVADITPQVKSLASPTDKKTCVGGMVTKLDAARIAVGSGISCVVANGRSRGVISGSVSDPGSFGTLFVPKGAQLAAKKRWIAFGTKTKGEVIVDDGARQALINRKSLLAVGVTGVSGSFQQGDIVSIIDKHHREFARGKTCFSSSELEKLKGQRLGKEVIHCDNIVEVS
ncbi:MAG: glutamate 5-kinase [Candidatus Omnitrophota bacterium]